MKKTLITSVALFIFLSATAQIGKTYHVFGTVKNPSNNSNLSLGYCFKKSDYLFGTDNIIIKDNKFDFRYKLTTDCDSLILYNSGVRFAKGLKDTTIDFGELNIDRSYAVIYYKNVPCSKTFDFISNYCYSSEHTINSYYWIFDDSTTSKLPNPSKWFKRIGNHKVILEITDNSGKYSKTNDVIINDTCQPNIVFLKFKTKNQSPLKGTINFSDQDTFNYDGKKSVFIKKLNPIYYNIVYFSLNYRTCNGKGNYSPPYIVWKKGMDTLDLGTLDECPCKIDFNFPGDDKQQVVGFINTSMASDIYYSKVKWTFGDGDTITKFDGSGSYYNQVFHKYAKKGSYKAKMEYYSPTCQGSIEKTINYKDTCTTLIYLRDTGSYSNDIGSSTLFMSANYLWPGVDSAKWDFGDGKSSSKLSLIHFYDSVKTYKLCAKTWQGGCESNACTTINVKSIEPCRADFEIVKDPNNKFGLLLKDKSIVTNAQYYWSIYDFKGGPYIRYNEPIFEHNFNEFGTYRISLSIEDPAIKCNSTYSEDFSFDSTGKLNKKKAFTLKVVGSTIAFINNIDMRHFKIYPIPAHEILTIDGEVIIQTVMILDNLGRKVKTLENINSENTNIDISDLISGFYSISIISQNQLINRKIIIK